MSPRTCIGCRRADERRNLVRLAVRESHLVVDSEERLPGRGAWIHPVDSCLDRAQTTHAVDRAFRGTVTDSSELATMRRNVSGGNPLENDEQKAGRNPMGTR